jgi:hypothetical protein
MMNEKVKSGYEEPVGKVQERLGSKVYFPWEYGRIIKGRVANMHKAHNNKRKVIQGMKSGSPFGTNYDIRKECDNVSGGLKEESFRH